jgi:hypothetical protein
VEVVVVVVVDDDEVPNSSVDASLLLVSWSHNPRTRRGVDGRNLVFLLLLWLILFLLSCTSTSIGDVNDDCCRNIVVNCHVEVLFFVFVVVPSPCFSASSAVVVVVVAVVVVVVVGSEDRGRRR